MFPSLKRTHNGRTVAYFDGPGGAQTVQTAIDSIVRYMTGGSANLHGHSVTSKETEALLTRSRDAVCTLFNARSLHEVAFGPNASTLMFNVARAIAKTWNPGDEIVVTEMDHFSNVDAWRTAAKDRDVTVKFIPLDTSTITLDLSNLDSIITPKTKLVAVGLASNCVGTIADIKTISAAAKKVGAIVTSDAVHAIPHFHVDMQELGIDMLFASVYKFFGPHVGMAIIRKEIFERLDVYKVEPAPDFIPDKLEMGTQNHEGIPAIVDVIEFLASLGEGDTLDKRLRSGYQAIEAHENALAEKIRKELGGIEAVTLYQAGDDVPKTPTVAFTVKGITPADFCIRMCEDYSIFTADGHFYALRLAEKLGILDSGAFIRVGMAPYNTMEEVERFIEGTKAIIASL